MNTRVPEILYRKFVTAYWFLLSVPTRLSRVISSLYSELRKIGSLGLKQFSKPRHVKRVLLDIKMTMLSKISKRVLFMLLVMIFFLVSVSIIAGLPPRSALISSGGRVKVKRVGVYEDSNCGFAMEYLDWGTLEPGSVQNVTVYVRNEGNDASTLFLTTINWNPSNASEFMSLGWNYDGRSLGRMEVVEATLTLSISSEVQNINVFSFDVVIEANG